MSNTVQLHWRWNVHPVWESYLAMREDASKAATANHEFERYRYVRSCLVFAALTIEAFMNHEMRSYMQARGDDEETIVKRLRHGGKFKDKLNQWPGEFCSQPLRLADNASALFDLFDDYYDVRNALVHPKDRDHSIYLKLESIAPEGVVESVTSVLITVYEAKPEPYPYWLLGWNFVGFNRDNAHPFLTDVSQFRHSLARLGIIRPSTAFEYGKANGWTAQMMTSRTGYDELKARLDEIQVDIEPWFEVIPGMGCPPRLCRRWWDRDFILSTIPINASRGT